MVHLDSTVVKLRNEGQLLDRSRDSIRDEPIPPFQEEEWRKLIMCSKFGQFICGHITHLGKTLKYLPMDEFSGV